MLATESLPFINKFMELEPLVSDDFKARFLGALAYDFFGCYLLYVLTDLALSRSSMEIVEI